jgi:hypothetical protein
VRTLIQDSDLQIFLSGCGVEAEVGKDECAGEEVSVSKRVRG